MNGFYSFVSDSDIVSSVTKWISDYKEICFLNILEKFNGILCIAFSLLIYITLQFMFCPVKLCKYIKIYNVPMLTRPEGRQLLF